LVFTDNRLLMSRSGCIGAESGSACPSRGPWMTKDLREGKIVHG
jgi:hypothetical protein